MQLFATHIRKACRYGSDLVARTGIAEACNVAGGSLASIGVGVPHSLGRALSALNNVLPGQAYAAYLVPTVQWTLPAGEEKLALVARVFDNTPSSLLLVGRPAEALPALLEDLQGDIGLPR